MNNLVLRVSLKMKIVGVEAEGVVVGARAEGCK
jgi:hypothetical protein